MGTHKISVSPEVEEAIQAAAELAGKPLAEWLAEAVEDQAWREAKAAEGRRAWSEAIAESEAEFGPTPEQDRQDARRALEDAKLARARRSAQELIDDYEAHCGPIPEESWRKAERFLAATGADSSETT